MNQTNSGIWDFYLLPRYDMDRAKVRLADSNGAELDSFRFDDLEPLFELAARSQLMELSNDIRSIH